MKRFHTSRTTDVITIHGNRRREHWYVDNQVYFITARCRDRKCLLQSDQAKWIFWDRLTHWTKQAKFTPWITSVLPNHYHILGYARQGELLTRMIQGIHGSVAKLVNDTLPERHTPFWDGDHGHTWFDGAIRNEMQARRTFAYIQRQPVRHRVCADASRYPHTRITVGLEPAIRRSLKLDAFLEEIPYKRYNS